MNKLLKDPLLHFLLIGALLFIVFELAKGPAGIEENRIIITRGDIEALQANFTRTWQRPPSEDELLGLIEEAIREEMAYREALALGLDQEDSVIRRRLRMKLELIMEDIAGLAEPTEEDLLKYLEEHRDAFHQEPQISFKQVYLNSDNRGGSAEMDARKMLATLAVAGPDADPESFGDPNMLPKELPLYSLRDIARLFGEEFSKQLLEVEQGTWSGPVWSSYGLHLVYVRERNAGRDPELDEVRKEVEREWTATQRREFKKEMYKKLRERYTVTVEKNTPSGSEK